MNDENGKRFYLGIAIAICAGYVAAHLVIRLIEHSYLYYPDQTSVGASAAGVLVGLFFAIRWLRRRLSPRARKTTLRVAASLCLIVLVLSAIGVAINVKAQHDEEAQRSLQVQKDHARYLQFLKEHPEWKGTEFSWLLQEDKIPVNSFEQRELETKNPILARQLSEQK